MNRPWNIAEQVIEDPTTKLRIEFTSVHTVEVEQGRPAPLHDEIIYLRLWTSDRTRVATYAFTRGGQFIKTAVEHVDPGVHPKLEDGIAQAPALEPRDEGPAQAPVESPVFGDTNYASQFTGDI